MAIFELKRDITGEEWREIITKCPGIAFYKQAKNTIYAKPDSAHTGLALKTAEKSLRDFKKYLKEHDNLA